MNAQKGFTLIELLVAMAIMGILVAGGLGNYRTSQAKSRDGRRKAELRQVAVALEAYYNDYGKYPDDDAGGRIKACAPDGLTVCAWGGEFKDQNSTIYMVSLPEDPASGFTYYYDAGGGSARYQLYARLENTLDSEVSKDANGNPQAYQGLSCGTKSCNYGIASTNSTASEGRTLVTE